MTWLDGRTAVALALTRTLLEGGVELSWAADAQLPGTPQERLLRILRRGYEALAEVSALSLAERAVLDDTVARGSAGKAVRVVEHRCEGPRCSLRPGSGRS